jgi:hypothetical protein
VLLFTLGVSIATGFVFGLAPLLHMRGADLVAGLRRLEGRNRRSAPSSSPPRLVMVEVALAVMLVVEAALLLRTVANLANVDAGSIARAS